MSNQQRRSDDEMFGERGAASTLRSLETRHTVATVLAGLLQPLLLGIVAWLGSSQLSDIKQAAAEYRATAQQTQVSVSALQAQLAVVQAQMTAYSSTGNDVRAQTLRIEEHIEAVDRRLVRLEARAGIPPAARE